MRILLSGGWGFGNLGDDAILLSTVNSIRQIYPNSKITILTANVNETSLLIKDLNNISIYQSLHSNVTFDRYGQNFISHFYRKVHDSYYRRCNKVDMMNKNVVSYYLSNPDRFTSHFKKSLHCFASLVSEHDIYIMSGGHYINDWIDSSITKHIECSIVRKLNLRSYIIGQTIGPFSGINGRIFEDIYDMVDCCFFRDEESIRECRDMSKVLPKMIPDIALFDIYDYDFKDGTVVFIPFTTEVLVNLKQLSDNFEHILRCEGCKKIIVSVSQLWKSQIGYAEKCNKYFISRGLDSELVIPKNVFELQELLGHSQCIVSQNLHGLILGFRANVPVISINSNRKFKGFMKIINAEEYILDINSMSSTELYKKYCDVCCNNRMFAYRNVLKDLISNALTDMIK